MHGSSITSSIQLEAENVMDGMHNAAVAPGRLIFVNGDTRDELLAGKTEIRPKTWHHVVMVRDGQKVAVYLDGQPTPDLAGTIAPGCGPGVKQIFLGGRSDGLFGLEGKLSDVALYGRALTPVEIADHFRAAGKTT